MGSRLRASSVVAGAIVVTAATAGTATSLPLFGTGPVTRTVSASTAQGELVKIRVGRHPTFDRIVYQFTGSTPGYRVRYVPRIIQDGSGLPVPILGRRFLEIRLDPARAHPLNGSRLNVPSTLTPLFPTLRQVKLSGDFEGIVSFGAGLSKRTGFRVFTLPSPRRVVVDVAR